MKRFCHFILMILFPLYGYCQNGDLKVEIERIILHDTEISLDDTPGFIIGIVDQDSTYIVEFGQKEKGSKENLSPTDIFELGSISKVMTASLTSVLVEKGYISYEDRVNSFLPIEYQNPRLDELEVKDLLQHTSSLPVRPYFFGLKEKDPQNPYGNYSKDDLLTFYTQFVPKEKGAYNYAHTNYALLEIILELATDQSFDMLIDNHLFYPMSMDSTFVFFKEKKQDVLTMGYDRAGRESSPWTFSSFGASEGTKSNMSDLLTFMKINLQIEDHPYGPLFDHNHKKHVATNFNDFIHTGNGWQIVDQKKNYDIIMHSGKTTGHNAFMAFIKETKTGVIVLSNSSMGTYDLGFLVLRMINYNWKRKA